MEFTAPEILVWLYGIVAVMLIVSLYHVLFIVVDLRKVLRRIERVTAQIEAVVVKPLHMTDQFFQWVMEHLEHRGKKKHHHNVFEGKKA